MNRDTPLLARYAEGLFWMARYLERVENLARLLDVTQTFESPGREQEAWFALIRINADEEGFAKRGLLPTADAVKRFYLLDHDNPSGIPACLNAARLNARTLRPLISHGDVEATERVSPRHDRDRRGGTGRRPALTALRPHQGGGAGAYRHHRGHVLP